MDKTASTLSGRHHPTAVLPSPRLVRSRSGSGPAAAITTPERSSHRFSSSERFTITSVQRSKSTSRTRATNNEGNNINLNSTLTTSILSNPTHNRVHEKKGRDDGYGKLMQRGVSPDINNVGASKRTTSTIKSPSAWALSPGRWSLNSSVWPQPPAKANDGGNNNSSSSVGGRVIKVLKYLKQRKVSSVQEEEYYRFRILHNRLLQLRFINARAEVVRANVKNIAEVCSFYLFFFFLSSKWTYSTTQMERVTMENDYCASQFSQHWLSVYKV